MLFVSHFIALVYFSCHLNFCLQSSQHFQVDYAAHGECICKQYSQKSFTGYSNLVIGSHDHPRFQRIGIQTASLEIITGQSLSFLVILVFYA
jgi:hypothetical protein